MAIKLHAKDSPPWLLLNRLIERAREELHAIQEDIGILCPCRTIHIVAPSSNLGLVLDGPISGGRGAVHVSSLDPLSPLGDQIKLKDKIIAIDGEDVRRWSPAEVGRLRSAGMNKGTESDIDC